MKADFTIYLWHQWIFGPSGFLGRGSKARESHHCHHVGIPNLGWKELLWCRLLFHCSFTISSGSGSGFLFLFRFFLYSFCFSSSSFSSIILWSKSYSTWYRKMLTIKCWQIISIFTFFSSSLALFFANRSFTLRSPLNLIIKWLEVIYSCTLLLHLPLTWSNVLLSTRMLIPKLRWCFFPLIWSLKSEYIFIWTLYNDNSGHSHEL